MKAKIWIIILTISILFSKNIFEMATENKEFENKFLNLETIKTQKSDLIENCNKKVRDL